MSSGPDLPYSIAVRFGDAILQAGFTSIPNLVLDHYKALGMNDHELVFTIHVWRFWWTERDPYPSLRTVAEKMGVTWRQAHRYAQSLESKQLLRITHRLDDKQGRMTNEYDFSPLIEKVIAMVPAKDFTPLPAAEEPPPDIFDRRASDTLDRRALSEMSDEEYPVKKDSDQEDQDPSSPRKTSSLHNQIYDEARVTLVEYITDLSAEFLDTASVGASTSRAVNLFKRSGLTLEEFINVMTEARAVTKEHLFTITKRTKEGDKTKMAYFFTVLEDRLGLRSP